MALRPYKGKYGSAVRLVESALGGPPPVTTDPNLSTVSTSAASVVANGVDSATITVTLVDVTGAPRVGHTVTLEDGPASSNIGPASGPSDANGQVSFAVTHTTAEVVTYTATDTTDAVTVTQTTDVTFTAPAPSGFTAYNDLAWGTGQLTTNITTITSPNGGSGLASSGQLLDFATGLPTPVSLTVTGGSFIGDVQAEHGTEPSPGTDAHALFAGHVSGEGALSYLNQANSPLVLTFTGLDPGKLYDLVYYAHRNQYAWDRASLVTLSGQDAFINISSTATDNPNGPGGALFSGPTDPATRLPADNDNGYVARFSQVDPGSDGVVVLTISFDGTAPYKGKYGSAVRLQE